jgi:hypothetical protein
MYCVNGLQLPLKRKRIYFICQRGFNIIKISTSGHTHLTLGSAVYCIRKPNSYNILGLFRYRWKGGGIYQFESHIFPPQLPKNEIISPPIISLYSRTFCVFIFVQIAFTLPFYLHVSSNFTLSPVFYLFPLFILYTL